MNTTTLRLGALGSLALLAPAATAQLSDVIVCDPINEQIFRYSDHDGSGFYDTLNEITVLVDWSTQTIFNPNSAEMRVEGGKPVIYSVADFPDGVYRMEDSNENGQIDDSEIDFFFDAQAAVGTINPRGIELTADGAVWFTSDFESTQGVWRAFDANADGTALQAGEAVQLVDGSAPFPVETDTGIAMVSADDFSRMAPDGNGVLVYSGFSSSCINGSLEAILRFEDKNLDGDVLDAGESINWLSYTSKNPFLPQNADFASGVLRSQEVNMVNTTSTDADCLNNSFWNRINHLTSQDEGGTTVYYVAGDSSATGGFGTNVANLGLSGLIYRCEDTNADGDVQDAGEVTLFFDGSPTSTQISGNGTLEKIVGLDAADGYIYVGDLVSGARIIRLRDNNADGDAMDAGEFELDLWTETNFNPVPPFPQGAMDPPGFGPGPFFEDIGAVAAGTWLPGTPNFVISGQACSEYGLNPVIGGYGQAFVGTSRFTARVTNIPGGSIGVLLIGASDTNWLGIPLPFDLSTAGFPAGCFIYQSLDLTLGFAATGSGAADGEVLVPFTFPNNPNLANRSLYLQWIVGNPFTVPFPTSAWSELGSLLILP